MNAATAQPVTAHRCLTDVRSRSRTCIRTQALGNCVYPRIWRSDEDEQASTASLDHKSLVYLLGKARTALPKALPYGGSTTVEPDLSALPEAAPISTPINFEGIPDERIYCGLQFDSIQPENNLVRFVIGEFGAETTNPALAPGFDHLVAKLVDASADDRSEARSLVLANCNAETILQSSLRQYGTTRNERFMLMAVSLLEELGPQGWPTLAKLARSDGEEVEFFVGLIARCEGVEEERRLAALKALARSPYTHIRLHVCEAARHFSRDNQRAIFAMLARDKSAEVREFAAGKLADLE